MQSKEKVNSFQITVKTSEYRGNHSADISIAINVPPNTTVQELVNLVFETGFKGLTEHGQFTPNKICDHIEIRVLNDLGL